MRKVVVRRIHAYRHKKHWRTIFPEDVFVLACCVVKLVVEWWKFESLLTFGVVFCFFCDGTFLNLNRRGSFVRLKFLSEFQLPTLCSRVFLLYKNSMKISVCNISSQLHCRHRVK